MAVGRGAGRRIPAAHAVRVRRADLLAVLAVVERRVLVGVVSLGVLGALLPLASALVTAALVRRVLAAVSAPPAGSGGLVPVLVALGAVLTVTQLVTLLQPAVAVAAGHQVDGWIRRLATGAASAPPGVDHLSDQAFRDDLALGTREAFGATAGSAAAAQLTLLSRYAGALLAAGVLAWYSVPAAVALFAGAVAMRALVVRPSVRMRHQADAEVAGWRRAEYWAEIASTPPYAKEVRVFNLAGWAIGNYRRSIEAQYRALWSARDGLTGRHTLVFAVCAGAVLGGLVALARPALGGTVDAGTLAGAVTLVWLLLAMARTGDEAFHIEGGATAVQAVGRLVRRAGRRAAVPATEGWACRSRPLEPGTTDLPPLVRFESVRFAYPASGVPVLDGLDLEIRPGEVLALVGLNGAGKTTLIKLLSGLHLPRAGRITVDGVDLRRLDPAGWRRRFVVVFQDFVRYPLTLRENVTLGAGWRPDDPALLAAAARDAGIEDFVAALPAGWETPLTRDRTGGSDLSGGQWQRVAMARAFYAVHAGARIMVLDEPTAHLDVRAEFDVFQRIVARRAGTSVVLISHRLSTVRRADRIVLLDGGRVTEQGTHDELLARDGTYARLFTLQASRLGPT